MFQFKFPTTNSNKQNLLELVFEDYLNDLNEIVSGETNPQGFQIETPNGLYYITNVNYNYHNVYVRAICYPYEFPENLIRMSTYPDEVTITVGPRPNGPQRP
jgi:hypothetical protein